MDWLAKLKDIVESNWTETGKVFLLAKAKAELERRGVNLFSELQARKLKDAILEDSDGSVRLVRNPSHPLVWGLIPGNVEIPIDLASLFTVHTVRQSDESHTPRFDRAVWTAFVKPASDGCRRFIEVGSPARFFDVSNDESAPPMSVEVDAQYFLGPAATVLSGEEKSKVEANIRRWAKDKGVALGALIAQISHSEAKMGGATNSFDIADFSGLSIAEKARILIPLDILAKIKFGR